jgi:hypothetical protein
MGDMSAVLWTEFHSTGGPTPWLYGPELVLALVSIVAIVSNASVIYITVRSK